MLCESYGVEFNKSHLKRIISLNDTKILDIILKHETARNRIVNPVYGINISIEMGQENFLKKFLEMDFKYNNNNIKKWINLFIRKDEFDCFLLICNKFDVLNQIFDPEKIFAECVSSNKIRFVEYLINQNKISKKVIEDSLIIVCKSGYWDIAVLILERYDISCMSGSPSIYEYAMKSDSIKLIELVHSKTRENLTKKEITSLIAVNCSLGNLELLQQYESTLIEIINQKINGKTLLNIACLNGQQNIVHYLLSLPNIDVNKVGPYHPLASAFIKNMRIVHELLDHPDINVDCLVPDRDDNLSHFEVEVFLCKDDELKMKVMKNQFFDPNVIIPKGVCKNKSKNLIHLLFNEDKFEILEKLIKIPKTRVNGYDYMNRTILYLVIRNSDVDTVKLLLEHPDIDINVTDFETNKTAIFEAIHQNNFEIVKLLLSRPEIELDLIDNTNKSIFDYVSSCKNIDIQNLFLQPLSNT